jgi:hypothetical protein
VERQRGGPSPGPRAACPGPNEASAHPARGWKGSLAEVSGVIDADRRPLPPDGAHGGPSSRARIDTRRAASSGQALSLRTSVALRPRPRAANRPRPRGRACGCWLRCASHRRTAPIVCPRSGARVGEPSGVH